MEQVLREAAGTGEIAAHPRPEILAAEVTAFLEGAAVRWLLDPEGVDLVAVYRSYLDGPREPPGGRRPNRSWVCERNPVTSGYRCR